MTAELAELNRAVAEKLGWKHFPESVMGDVWVPPNWDETLGQMFFDLPDFTTGEWTARLLEALVKGGKSPALLLEGRQGEIIVCEVYMEMFDKVRTGFEGPTLGVAVARAFVAAEVTA